MPDTARPQTRPRNRRDLILASAAEQFTQHGYAAVSMADLADAVGIGASALYRHFKGKQDVLAQVIAVGLVPAGELLGGEEVTDVRAAVHRLASFALDQRHMGVMWQREARHLTAESYQEMRAAMIVVVNRLAGLTGSHRPELSPADADLLAWSALAVLTSPSFHHLQLPRGAFEQVLTAMVMTVLDTPLPEKDEEQRTPATAAGLKPASRREELLEQATRLFAARGYTEVSIEDVGNAVGMAGPSVYKHWSSKLELLTTILRRGADVLGMDTAAAYRVADSPADAVHRLLRSYVRVSSVHPDVFSLLLTDTEHLLEEERHAIRRYQHEYVSEWVHLLRQDQPDQDSVAVRIRVHAVLSVVHDTARTRHLRRSPAYPADVMAIGTALLGG
jgi:AcrR family transcriptional regulator